MLPIQIASYRAWADMVQMLAAYVNVNFYGVVGFSALHAACVPGDITTVQVLIDNKADVNKTANWGHVIYAIDRYTEYQRRSKAKQIIFSEKAEISPLLIACLYKHKSIVELLLKNGACLPTHIDIIDIETVPECIRPMIRCRSPGSLLLALASANNDNDMFNLLERYGAKYVVDVKVRYPLDIPLD
ncbi:ANKRD50 [Mytilus edulis]|uniref:ANKRD50 n=1 Tax=Mytilus edulis TaxID=6550 RepID=A0A8S3SFU0_MYTED|nr:ANKRD50 [Mytilus edulis]